VPRKKPEPAAVSTPDGATPPPLPADGWIRAERTRQNLQGKQLAKRMQVSPARISVLEKDEKRGAVTLKMMQRAAEALDCRFVYALVPKASSRQAKPRIRLDSEVLKHDSQRQMEGLQQAWWRRLSETAPD
jgi:predicted DNA-binding mobile mystery protein A